MANQRYQFSARTTSFTGDDNAKIQGLCGLKAVIDVTAVPGVDTVTLVIEGKDLVSGKYYTILQSAAIVAVSTVVLTVYPGVTVAANVAASDVIPDLYRVRVVHSAATSFSYTVGVTEIA